MEDPLQLIVCKYKFTNDRTIPTRTRCARNFCNLNNIYFAKSNNSRAKMRYNSNFIHHTTNSSNKKLLHPREFCVSFKLYRSKYDSCSDAKYWYISVEAQNLRKIKISGSSRPLEAQNLWKINTSGSSLVVISILSFVSRDEPCGLLKSFHLSYAPTLCTFK